MQVTTEKTRNRLVIRASGRFDAAGAKVVADALEQALTGGSHDVEIDMGAVDYLSSAGIRVLVSYYQKFTRLRGGLYLTSVNERISQLLEMTGLYNLLDTPDEDGRAAPNLPVKSFDGWTLTSRVPEPDGRFVPRIIGRPASVSPDPSLPAAPEVLAFTPGILAFGTGALGYDAGECTGRYGPFLAAGGYAAYRPREEGQDPDFEEYAEAYIPGLHVLSATALTGSFALQASFESGTAAPGVHELAGSLLPLCNAPAIAFVLAAECEVPPGILHRPGSGTSPEGAGMPGPVAADGSRLCLVLAGGITAGQDGVPDPLKPVFAHPEGCGRVACIHAVVFTYQPLRRHGRVTLKDTAGALFESELLDVVPLAGPGGNPVPEIRLLRGLAWASPLEAPR